MAVFDFEAYSGYLNVDEHKSLHYYFAEAQNSPADAPLVIWFNGGPGCSSMLGWAQEHGPFVMEDGETTFHENWWSWNREANMLYIESPAGVGYSHCEGQATCNNWSDDIVAEDNLAAVLAWFDKFPEFQEHPLWISGESYAGIYVPYLAHAIDQHNENAASDDFKPNLQGFAVGNGVTNYDYDCTPAYIEMAYWHSLYNDELHDAFAANECDFTGPYMQKASDKCQELFAEFQSLVADVNIYDIFGICYGPFPYPQMYEGAGDYKKAYTAMDYTPFLTKPATHEHQLSMLPPCTFGNPITDYFNRSDVRQALHIPSDIQAWELCSTAINLEYRRDPNGSQWIYEALKGKYQMLHYSGDVDGAVPTLGTQNWIATLDWEVTEDWRPYMVNDQVAGYLEAYADTFTFATVHGAGHMAPQFKRAETYHLVFNWINGQAI